MSSNDLEVYVYRGNKGEQVPNTVERLIVSEGVQELPEKLCFEYQRLQEVTLPNGLINIGNYAFYYCGNLLEISICSMVENIGTGSFWRCTQLTKVEFEIATTRRNQPATIDIGEDAFFSCTSLQRINLPSSATSQSSAFEECFALIEANLSATGLTEIPGNSFLSCSSLLTISLPNTLEQICPCAFSGCSELVTVVVPLDSQPIRIGEDSFFSCGCLTNLVLPKDSTAEEDSFEACELLSERYGDESSHIVAGLMGRFTNRPVHRMCYDHSRITVQELQQYIKKQGEAFLALDEFGMTVFHVLFSTVEPRVELLEVLLDQEYYSYQVMKWKDSNGKRPLDYLVNNWTDGTRSLLQRTLQKWTTDRLARWGTTSWVKDMQTKMQEVLVEDDKQQRTILCNEAYSAFGHYENVQATSILEMALWKGKLKSGWSDDGSKRQGVDPVECRCVCGSDVVIPNVTSFLFA